MDIESSIERWPLKTPFRISGHTLTESEVLLVTVRQGRFIGRGEATAPYYKRGTLADMQEEIARATAGRADLRREDLPFLLPEGGARNALDCALWDLEAQRTGHPVRKLAGLDPPQPLPTTYTIGAGDPMAMAATARQFRDATHIKLKLLGDEDDTARVRAVRLARPDVWLMVDANQGFTLSTLRVLLPRLVEAGVSLIEQPLPVGRESELDGLRSPIPIVADESVQGLDDLAPLAGRFDVINIKLDKCGGLTDALAMVEESRALGFKLMVGNMMGTSLSLAPAYLVGQLCDFVDLDGALFVLADREPPVTYSGGLVTCPEGLWGHPR